MPAIRVVVKGYVQGVGFRHYVQSTAEATGVKGEVWNGLDRAVHVIAQHDDEAVLKRFEEEMWRGPGRVDKVLSEPCMVKAYYGFGVSSTR